MKIKFCGATQTVTGSSFLIDLGDKKILLDCGLYQEVNSQVLNSAPFEFNPSQIDYLFLTHAHLDHCGLIPKLVKNGFKGKIYCTFQTLELVKIILNDAAKIQELNVRLNRNGVNTLIYDTADVEYTLTKFLPVKALEEIIIDDNLSVNFLPVGHILGASSVYIKTQNGNILFSGDVGRVDQSIIKSFDKYNFDNFSPNFIIMESLYGDKLHEDKSICINEMINSIKTIKEKNSKLLIPVFAMHRAQEILEILNYLIISNNVDKDFSIFLDSPMAIEICKIYMNNINEFNDSYKYLNDNVKFEYSINKDIGKSNNLEIKQDERFIPQNLKYVDKQKKSKRLINAVNAVIMAGSGMADGGRIIKHLYNGLENGNNIVLLVGFQAENTLGRQLAEGQKKVVINDKEIDIKASIKYLRGFSAHADQGDLLKWLSKFDTSNLHQVFLVHGEEQSKLAFSEILKDKGFNNSIPLTNQEIELV